MIIIPEVILLGSMKAFLELIRKDYSDASDKTKTILHRALNTLALEKYGFYDQGVEVFVPRRDKNRILNVNIFFNTERAATPTIHITLPDEKPSGDDGLGTDEGFQDNVDNGDGTYRKVFTRRFKAQYNLVITSDNSNEVVLIYHFMRSFFIPLLGNFAVTGLENIKISGGDLNLRGILPPQVFSRTIGLNFDYDVNAQNIVDDETISKLIFNSIMMVGDTEGLPSSTDVSGISSNMLGRIISNEIPVGVIDNSNTLFTLANNYLAGSTMLYLNGQRLMFENNDYSEVAPNKIQFVEAPQTGDVILVDYLKVN